VNRPQRPDGAHPAGNWRLATVATTLWLLAATPVQAGDDAALRLQLEQKIRLVSTLISDSPAAQRITSSGNPQAMAHLDEGRVHHAVAADLLARGDLPGARKAIDDALQHLSLARRMVPDAPARQAAARQRYGQLLASLERLMDAWRARAGILANDDGQDHAAAQGLVGLARQQAQENRFDEANQSLAQAERHVLAGMNRTLHATTLDYTLRSTSPAEEFQNELARHRGFVDLLPLAVRDLQPRAEALALIERYGETSRTLETQALAQFQAGDTTQALESLRSATQYLQRALSAAGLAAPPPIGITP
jgi:tetratricopeptide (TPR) repeat protein